MTDPTSGAADLPEALRYANTLDTWAIDLPLAEKIAAELRRLHALRVASHGQAPTQPDPRIVDFKCSFFADSSGRTIPVVTVNFQPNDWDARDAFAASIDATPTPQAAQQAPAGATGWEYSKIESRIKELMAGTAHPNSTSVAQAMKQLVNELWHEYGQVAAPKPAPPADSVLEDAARYRHLRDCNSGSLVVVQITGTGEDDVLQRHRQHLDRRATKT